MGSEESVKACAEQVLSLLGGAPDGLVNNAGYGHPGALEDVTREDMRRQFEVNVFGLLDLTNRFLPAMIKRGSGRVVHISSVVGRVSLPFMGIYSASKFAVEAIADAQRVELDRTGIHVSLVEPGPIVTRFYNNASTSGDSLLHTPDSRFAELYQKELQERDPAKPKPFALPPEAVAKKIAHALTANRPRKRYKVTLPAHLGALMSRLAPDGLIDAILKHELRSRK
jgi:short-subunit dehydrogenase